MEFVITIDPKAVGPEILASVWKYSADEADKALASDNEALLFGTLLKYMEKNLPLELEDLSKYQDQIQLLAGNLSAHELSALKALLEEFGGYHAHLWKINSGETLSRIFPAGEIPWEMVSSS